MSIQERTELQNQLKEALAQLDFERKDKRAREVRPRPPNKNARSESLNRSCRRAHTRAVAEGILYLQ